MADPQFVAFLQATYADQVAQAAQPAYLSPPVYIDLESSPASWPPHAASLATLHAQLRPPIGIPAMPPTPNFDNSPTQVKSQTGNFTIAEDKAICFAFINVYKDPIVGVNQISEAYWDRVHKFLYPNTPVERQRPDSPSGSAGELSKKILQGFVATKPNKTGKTNPARRKKIGLKMRRSSTMALLGSHSHSCIAENHFVAKGSGWTLWGRKEKTPTTMVKSQRLIL
ncbi:hypothetical protein GQ55_2G111600 [Panicum hallii var. hallii]|uniref:Uncharacterized protein n=1 Tax=Panicum hallii var. hallii TaxID=1504633 RepID=A0A2T7ENT1_9POAL|nr:hypothetical protein GQ55_2G111600 [Panicum hallii var. hallii]